MASKWRLISTYKSWDESSQANQVAGPSNSRTRQLFHETFTEMSNVRKPTHLAITS